jgi:tetratricopeptide (TPR) repeat protein
MLLIGTALTAGAVHLIWYVQVHRQAKTFIVAADRAKEAGRLNQAIQHLYSYLRVVPADIDQRQRLGFWLAEAHSDNAAFGVLEEVLRGRLQGPTDAEEIRGIRRKLVDVAMGIRRWPDVKTHLRSLLQETPDDPELLDLMGQCEVALGRDESAAQFLQHAIKVAPQQVETYAKLAFVLSSRLDQFKQGEKWMQEMVRVNPKSARAHDLMGRYLYLLGRYQPAMAEAKQALDLAPEDPLALWLAGRCTLELQQYAVAAEYAKRGIKAAKQDPSMYLLLADIKTRTGQRDEALAAAQDGLLATKGTRAYVELLGYKTNMHIEFGQIAEAKKFIDELRRVGYPRSPLRCIEARIDFAEGHWARARTTFEEIRPDFADTPTLKFIEYWIGECYGRAENVEQQLAAYRRAVAADPFFHLARVAIAQILLNQNRVTAALDEYRQAMKSGRTNEMLLLAYARALILQNKRLNRNERHWEEALHVLDQASELVPDSTQVAILRIEILLAEDRDEQAEAILIKLRDLMPDRVDFWTALAAIAMRQEKWDKAEKLLTDAKEKVGDCVPLRLARAQYLYRHYYGQSAPAIRELAESCSHFSDHEKVALWTGLVRFCIEVEDMDTSKMLAMRIAEKEPNNTKIRYVLFDLALRTREDPNTDQLVAELQKLLDQIESIGGQSPLWLHGRALCFFLQARSKNTELLDKALDCIARARETRPAWSPLPLLAGTIYETEGKMDLALENYVQAINLGDRSPDTLRTAVKMLYQRQRYAEADRLFRRLVDKDVALPDDLNRDWTDILMNKGDFWTALEHIKNAVPESSRDYHMHLWRGQVMALLARRARLEGKTEIAQETRTEAEKSLRKALELQSHSADCWVTLVKLLADTDQRDKAREAIARAKNEIPKQTAPLALGHCYEAVGDLDQARQSFDAALKSESNRVLNLSQVADFYFRNNRLADAEPLIRQLIDAKGKTGEDTVCWARRMMAEILKSRGDFPSLTEAIGLIDQNLASSFAAMEDQRVKTRLLLADPRSAKRDEAIKMVEGLIESGEAVTADDRFQLAQLYLLRNEWSKYAAQMRSVLGSDRPKPEFVLFHVRALIRRNEIDEADLWLGRLEKILPNDMASTSLRADVLVRRNHVDEAMQLVEGFVDKPDARPTDRSERLDLAAGTMEQLAGQLEQSHRADAADRFRKKAEAWFRVNAAAAPAGELTLAAYLARRDRFKESLELIDHAWANSTGTTVARTCLGVAGQSSISAEQIDHLQSIVEKAMKKFDRPRNLLIASAYLSMVQQRYADAEASYREVLAKNADDFLALNDLAVLLALEGKKLDESLDLINRAIKVAGPVASILDSRAVIYIAQGHADKALADIELAVGEEVTPVRLFHRARALFLAGKTKEAHDALEEADKKGFKRAMLDPPERDFYDKVRQQVGS